MKTTIRAIFSTVSIISLLLAIPFIKIDDAMGVAVCLAVSISATIGEHKLWHSQYGDFIERP